MLENTSPATFRDAPPNEQLLSLISGWPVPNLPPGISSRLSRPETGWFPVVSDYFKTRLALISSLDSSCENENVIIKWLFEYIRLNVKRGRYFSIPDVLKSRKADCLGYVKLFTLLGRQCGLKVGAVEVIVDNRGCSVPHSALLVKLSSGGLQFIDFWYGSLKIRHKRLGLQTKVKNRWYTRDIDRLEARKAKTISYLPDDQVDAITWYIEGNRALKESDYAKAIELYSAAIELYPQNARLYYNRAVGYEKMGQPEKAQPDYALALKNSGALKRALAAQPPDVVELIKLDELAIPDYEQAVYLLNHGFITGNPESPQKIAGRLSISMGDVESVLREIERKLEVGCVV